MIPIVALLGRPNVGKSTLFNHLTGSQEALVADVPGVTRDRRYRLGDYAGRSFVAVDTGGITVAHTEMEQRQMQQTHKAIEEADVLVLMVDVQAGCVSDDVALHAQLRACNKPLVVAVNKVDGRDAALALAEFAELGAAQLFAISARRGSGVKALMEAVVPEETSEAPDQETEESPRIAVIGRPNAGKSTLINRLLQDERLVVSEEPGTTRDSIDVQITHQDQLLTLVDTAGIRRKSRIASDSLEAFSVAQALRAIKRAHVAVVVIDAQQGPAEQDAALVSLALDAGRAVVVALNKCDSLNQEQQAWVEHRLQRRLRFAAEVPVLRTSGRRGFGLARLLREAVALYKAAGRHFSTPMINAFLEQAVRRNPPPRVRGGRIHLRYAHQGGNHPLRLVLHGTHLELMPPAYQRYLVGRFRRMHRLPGIPVLLVRRTSRRR